MPSNLRFQASIEPTSAETARYEHTPSPPTKKQKMSLSQTYFVAASARQKLGREAGRADHNLRRLVGHANLLDNLMVDLADAEREQEAWFHQSTTTPAKPSSDNSRVRWADRVAAETATIVEEDEVDSDDDEDSDGEDYEDLVTMAPLRRVASQPSVVYAQEAMVFYDGEDEDEDVYEDLEDDEEHALVRTPSQQSPPELVHDDDLSDDESTASSGSTSPVASPPQPSLAFPEPDRKEALASTMPLFPATATRGVGKDDHSLDLLLSEANNAPLVASY